MHFSDSNRRVHFLRYIADVLAQTSTPRVQQPFQRHLADIAELRDSVQMSNICILSSVIARSEQRFRRKNTVREKMALLTKLITRKKFVSRCFFFKDYPLKGF